MATIPITYADYRALAEARLPKMLFDYIDGGSFSESTLAANTDDLAALKLRQRVLRDVSRIDTSTSLLDRTMAMPLVLAPIGLAGLMARRGEVQAARAAEAAGIPFTLSTVGVCSIEEVKTATKTPFWFQLYMIKDRGYIAELIGRAKAAQCSALVLTVDLAVTGTRYRDARNGMTARVPLPNRIGSTLNMLKRRAWLRDVALGGKPLVFGNLAAAVPNARNLDQFRDWVAAQFDASVTWSDVEWVRGHWHGPLIIKGVLDAEDALAAASAGASAVVVSNHGGRQLDGAPSTIAALPRIAEALAGGSCEVLMDGGVRSGQDIARVLASGARAALIGRPWIFALAAEGEKGVARMLSTTKSELEVTLALLGEPRASELGRGALV